MSCGSTVGKNISLMEMSKLLPAIVHKYDVDFINPADPYKTTEHWCVAALFCTVLLSTSVLTARRTGSPLNTGSWSR